MTRVTRAQTPPFKPHTFLREVGSGKTILPSPNKHTIFSQGDAADAVFYIQAGKVKLTVVSQQGKEAVIAILEEGAFFLGNPASPDTRFARRPRPPWKTPVSCASTKMP